MPWDPSDAIHHTKAANTPAKQERWAKIANERLEATGDEALAIREANAAVKPKVNWS